MSSFLLKRGNTDHDKGFRRIIKRELIQGHRKTPGSGHLVMTLECGHQVMNNASRSWHVDFKRCKECMAKEGGAK